MAKQKTAINQPEDTQKQVLKIHTIEEFVQMTNTELADMLYISVPEKTQKRNYRNDFKLLSNKELQEFIKDKKIKAPETQKECWLFVYNLKTDKVSPFKKDEYLMSDTGYMTFDGKTYYGYNDNGDELRKF